MVALPLLVMLLILVVTSPAAAVPCPGGVPFSPSPGTTTCDMPADGIFNFTTITIPAGATVRFARNAANTPVTLNATGNVVVNGTIDVSASGQQGGPGGGDGGAAGLAFTDGGDGTGPSPGAGGAVGTPRPGHAGGGGGMATAGATAIRHTASLPAPGGSALPFPSPLSGGSGGGGGGGWNLFGVNLNGGQGAGGGGAVRISTPAAITIAGSIVANGAGGGTGFANAFGFGGPGGGGSGGVIDLDGGVVTLASTALLRAKGGPGGGISTLPIFSPVFSSEANGGLGYARIVGTDVILNGLIDAFPILGAGPSLPISHFLCYKVLRSREGPALVPPSGVTLTDQFETGTLVNVLKSVSLCAPADKNDEGVADDATHLKGYQIRLTSTRPAQPKHVPRKNVTIVNQFGTLLVDTITPDRLLVPAATDLTSPASPPAPGGHDVDHFRCYKVKMTKGHRFTAIPGVSVVDQFNESLIGSLGRPKLFDVKKPTRLCAPADKNGEGIKDEGRHLMCYQVTKARNEPKHVPVHGVHVADQFGPEELNTITEEELCVPSLTATSFAP